MTIKRYALPLMVLLVIGTYSLILSRYVKRFDGNLSGVVCLGDRFLPPGVVTEDTFYLTNSVGYDGQFFFFIAHDPFIRGNMHAYMDDPAYRYQRVLYPLLVAFASLGGRVAIPFMMIAVNIGAIAIGMVFCGLLFRRQGMSPWYALFYGFLSGLLIAVLRALAEPVAMAALVAALYCYAERRPFGYITAMSLALLGRETNALMIPVLLIDAGLLRRDRLRAGMAAVPMVAFAAWLYYIYVRIGVAPWEGGRQNVGRPLVALLNHMHQCLILPDRWRPESIYLVVFVAGIVLGLAYAVREIARSRDEISLGFLGFSLMPFFMTHKVWVEPWSYGRTLLPAAVFLVLAFARSRDRWYLVPLAVQAGLFVIALAWQNIRL